MRECLYCPHEGPDDTFAHYRDASGHRRPRNICLECSRRHGAARQATYKERNLEFVRQSARDRKYLKYHNDPKFRARCVEETKKKP